MHLETGWRGSVAGRLLALALLGAWVGAAAPTAADPGRARPAEAPATGPDLWAIAPAPGTIDLAGRPGAVAPGPRLARLVAAVEAGAADGALGAAVDLGLRVEAGRVRLELRLPPERLGEARTAVASVGGVVSNVAHDRSRLLAWLPPRAVPAIASLGYLSRIAAPVELVALEPTAGGATSEAVDPTNAALWHDRGHRGRGVRVGIVDMGFKGYAALLASDLPPAGRVRTRNFVGLLDTGSIEGQTNHGTACAEIVHDLAPDAELYLARITTVVEMDEAIDWLIANDVRIVSSSIGTAGLTPGDGSGAFARMAERTEAADILWVTAAGNFRQQHWAGAFSDADGDAYIEFAGQAGQPAPTASPRAGPGTPTPSPVTVQEIDTFGPDAGRAYRIPAGVDVSLAVRYHASYGAREVEDAADGLRDVVVELWRNQSGSWVLHDAGGDEVERWSLPNGEATEVGRASRAAFRTSGPAAMYGVAVRLVRAPGASRPPDNIEVFCDQLPMSLHTPARSLSDPATVAAVKAVAAADVGSRAQEPYSSEGPTNGRGGAPTGGIVKPDITGYANVSTVSYGQRGEAAMPFNGTSAAAPHVAGLAALVAGSQPTAGRAALWQALGAIDAGATGVDTRFGRGLVVVDASPPPSPPTPTPVPWRGLALPRVLRGG